MDCMAYAISKTISVDKIPIIDVTPLRYKSLKATKGVALEIRKATDQVGFFYIRNHGISKTWDPNFDSVVDPSVICNIGSKPLYPPVSCGDNVLSRFDSSFSYRR